MRAKPMSDAKLRACTLFEADEMNASGIADYLEPHGDGGEVLARFQVLLDVMRYVAVWQPPEFLLAGAKSLYRSFSYVA